MAVHGRFTVILEVQPIKSLVFIYLLIYVSKNCIYLFTYLFIYLKYIFIYNFFFLFIYLFIIFLYFIINSFTVTLNSG